MRLFDSAGHQLAVYYYGYNSAARIDYQKLFRFSAELNAHHFKAAC